LDIRRARVKCVSTLDLGVAPAGCNAIYGYRQGAAQSVRILCRAFTVLRRDVIALLLADGLSAEQRKAVGSTLALVGLDKTIPAFWAVFRKCEEIG